jgi:lysozyme
MDSPVDTPAPRSKKNLRMPIAALVLVTSGILAGNYVQIEDNTKKEEGVRRIPYDDIKKVKTVCVGSTKNVENRPYTMKECNDRLRTDLYEHGTGMLKCVKVPLSMTEYEAYLDFTFNVGTGAFCKSTMVKLLNEGKYPEACAQILRWVKQPELAGRRKREYAKCMTPVDTKEEVPDVQVTQPASVASVPGQSTVSFWQWMLRRS